MDAVTLALITKKLTTKASLVDGKVPADELPSYVDDAVEYDDADHFPAEGEAGKIYIALDTGYTYRWSGSTYVQIGGQDLSDYYTKEETQIELSGKQDNIEDLSDIRSGAGAGATAVQPADVICATEQDIRELFHPMPQKGQIISFNAHGDESQRFVVLARNGSEFKLVTLESLGSGHYQPSTYATIVFDNGQSYTRYTSSSLETVATNYYNNLKSNVKEALVQKDVIQTCYSLSTSEIMDADLVVNTDFYGTYYLKKVTQKTYSAAAYVRSIDISDLQSYFQDYAGAVPGKEILKITIGQEEGLLSGDFWLMTAAENQNNAFIQGVYQGHFSDSYAVKGFNYHYKLVFTINLSQIDFTIEGGNN